MISTAAPTQYGLVATFWLKFALSSAKRLRFSACCSTLKGGCGMLSGCLACLGRASSTALGVGKRSRQQAMKRKASAMRGASKSSCQCLGLHQNASAQALAVPSMVSAAGVPGKQHQPLQASGDLVQEPLGSFSRWF